MVAEYAITYRGCFQMQLLVCIVGNAKYEALRGQPLNAMLQDDPAHRDELAVVAQRQIKS
jgi:hypothetical protein